MILVLEFALQWWADIPSTVNYFKMSEYDEKKPIISTEDNINTEEIVVSAHIPLHCFSTQYYNLYGVCIDSRCNGMKVSGGLGCSYRHLNGIVVHSKFHKFSFILNS